MPLLLNSTYPNPFRSRERNPPPPLREQRAKYNTKRCRALDFVLRPKLFHPPAISTHGLFLEDDDFDDFGEGYISIWFERGESRGRKSGEEKLKGWKRLWDRVEVSRRVGRIHV